MRFVMHRTIAEDVFNRGAGAFRFGCVAPDYAKWDKVHRPFETYERTMDWFESQVNSRSGKDIHCDSGYKKELRSGCMKELRSDFLIGMVCHFICDYCCHAHWEKYYSFIAHRIYEVELQKFYIRKRTMILEWYENYRASGRTLYEDFKSHRGNVEGNLREFLLAFLNGLNDENNAAADGKWYRSETIMINDIKAAYMSLDLLYKLVGEGRQNGREESRCDSGLGW